MRFERRKLRDYQNAFELPEDQFIKIFRLSKNLIRNIIDNIQPYAQQRRRRSSIPLHLRVLATMHFLGHGSFQKAVGLSGWTCMSQTLISRSISEVCKLITEHLLQLWVNFPINFDQENENKLRFYENWGMRGIIGVIDGTHVEIIAPPRTDVDHPPFVYINRKGKHSINVMLICDANQKLLAIDARYPGSVHDSAIFRTSEVRNHLRNKYNMGQRGSYLIGDSGYGSEPWLLTPFLQTQQNTPEERYNTLLKSARNVIERTNGIWKRRFSCLSRHRTLLYHPSRAAYIIYACAVLHNMALHEHIPLLDANDNERNEVDDPEQEQDHNEINFNEVADLGRQTRQNYVRANII